MTVVELEKDQVYYFICGDSFHWKQGCTHIVLGAVECFNEDGTLFDDYENFDFDIFVVMKGCRHWRAGTRIDMDSIKAYLKEYHPEL